MDLSRTCPAPVRHLSCTSPAPLPHPSHTSAGKVFHISSNFAHKVVRAAVRHVITPGVPLPSQRMAQQGPTPASVPSGPSQHPDLGGKPYRGLPTMKPIGPPPLQQGGLPLRPRRSSDPVHDSLPTVFHPIAGQRSPEVLLQQVLLIMCKVCTSYLRQTPISFSVRPTIPESCDVTENSSVAHYLAASWQLRRGSFLAGAAAWQLPGSFLATTWQLPCSFLAAT